MNTQVNVNHPLIQSPRSTDCRAKGWKAQFACPTGRLGRLAGHLMAIKNAKMNRFAVETLDVQPDDQVLEIDFGHGRAIQAIAKRATIGFVAGVDLSDVMVEQTAKRNSEAIKAGRVELCQGTVADIPYEYARFTKVLAVNNYQFWPNPEHNLAEIQRVMRAGGLLVLCLRMKEPGKAFQLAPGLTEEEVEEIAGLVRWVGFHDVRTVQRRSGHLATCVLARR